MFDGCLKRPRLSNALKDLTAVLLCGLLAPETTGRANPSCSQAQDWRECSPDRWRKIVRLGILRATVVYQFLIRQPGRSSKHRSHFHSQEWMRNGRRCWQV